MSVYIVYEPPLRAGASAPDPERFSFVRDGFHFWAMVFGPLWLLWRRMWLALLFYAAIVAVLSAGLWLARAGNGLAMAAAFFVALLLGLEAPTLMRWTLRRRGWREAGLIVADDLESAERRFFAQWAARPVRATPPVAPSVPPAMPRTPSSGIVGLFPEPGSGR